MKKQVNPEGQLSFWDMEVPKSVNAVVKKIEKISEEAAKITHNQEKVINKYKLVDELNRVINYAGGGVGIELKCDTGFKTIYINKLGEEEFVTSTQIPVQPIDQIIIYKNSYESVNEIQAAKLIELKEKHKIKEYIKRNGDINIIVKVNEKVIAINPKGWLLEYSEAIYKENEVFRLEEKNSEYKVGDKVEAMHGKEKIIGTIVRKYENQDTFNIVWGNKHSAFHFSTIKRKIA